MRSIQLIVILVFAANSVHAEESKASAKEAKAGFVSLFDGKTLKGWQGATDGYAVENGLLVCKKEGGGNLFTAKEYGDFVFRVEYKMEAGGNNGVGIRAPLQGTPGFEAMEIQLLDDDFPEYRDWTDVRFNGSVYGAVAAKRGFTKKAGQWNTMEIRAKGTRIQVKVNGQKVVDADMTKVGPKRIHDHDLNGLTREKGYIAFCGHGHRFEFRNVRIKELKKKSAS